MKTSYIVLLPTEVQQSIKKELMVQGLNEEEINDAMNSRLCDLEDTINIKPYLKFK